MSNVNPFAPEDSTLDAAIASAYSDLETHDADSDAYRAIISNLSELYKLKNSSLQHYHEAEMADLEFRLKDDQNTFEEMQATKPFYQRVDPNTVLTVAGNILIGFAVIKYEQKSVISSKVFSFMKKM